MNKKTGNVTTPIILIMSLGFILVLTIYVLNTILPFVWYQKLQTVANKYLYVTEKFRLFDR